MNPQPCAKFNADAVRAALRSTEVRLVELMKDLEMNDLDEGTMEWRLRTIEQDLRRTLRAA